MWSEKAPARADFDCLPRSVRTARQDCGDGSRRGHHTRRVTRGRKYQRDRIAAAGPLGAGYSAAGRDEVVIGVEVGVGTEAAERRNAQRDRTRVHAANRFVVETQLAQPRGSVSGDDDIGPSDQLFDASTRCAIV